MNYELQYIRPMNDLHLDFDIAKNCLPWTPPELDTDHLTALVLAGDIWHARKYLSYADKSWLAELSRRFRYVIFVLGNHDYWGSTLNHEPEKVNAEIKEQNLTNVFLIQDNHVDIEGVRFVGGTLWTDFNKQDPITKMSWKNVMIPDSKKIRKKIFYSNPSRENNFVYYQITADDLFNSHQKTKKYIFDNVKKDQSIRKMVVVTHMAPSALSIDEAYKASVIDNGYYYSEFGNEIADSEIDFWFHGHTHSAKDYFINNTRVINNARGYVGYERNNNFDDKKLIKL